MDTNLASFIRMALAAGAAFIIGKTFWGTPITSQVADTAIATIMEAIAVIWSLVDHTATVEKIQSTVRNVIAFAGGFFVSRGLITAETSLTIGGALVALATYVYSRLSKKKTTQLMANKIQLTDLKVAK